MKENNISTELKLKEFNFYKFKKNQLEIYFSLLSIKDKTTNDELIKDLNSILKKQLIILNEYGFTKKTISDILKYKDLLS